MKKLTTLLCSVAAAALALLTTPVATAAAPAKPTYKLAVSIYAGWMPWYHANEEGIIKKWADKYGVNVEVQYMDYVPSLEAYVAGKVDAVVCTNMEALDMPAAAGVDTSVIIVGDYSNGNDAILTRGKINAANISGKTAFLCEKTVSQYLLCRFLDKNGLPESAVPVMNVSDADIAPSFLANKRQQVVVTWNPMVMEIAKKAVGVTNIFDSSAIPGEVQDLCVVNTKVVNANPNFARALTGAWYEVMGQMSQRGANADAAINKMAVLAKCSPIEFRAQLKTTAMYYTAQSALDFTTSKEIQDKNNLVRKFCFDHALLGDNAPSVDVVGISYPDGTIQGDAKNVKLRYVKTFMEEAATGVIK